MLKKIRYGILAVFSLVLVASVWKGDAFAYESIPVRGTLPDTVASFEAWHDGTMPLTDLVPGDWSKLEAQIKQVTPGVDMDEYFAQDMERSLDDYGITPRGVKYYQIELYVDGEKYIYDLNGSYKDCLKFNLELKDTSSYYIDFEWYSFEGWSLAQKPGKGSFALSTTKEVENYFVGLYKVKQPYKPYIKSLKPAKRALTVSMGKVAADYKGHWFQARYKIKGTKKWTYKTYKVRNSKSFKIKSLKKGKRYTVQVRVVDALKSKWSKAKTSGKVK